MNKNAKQREAGGEKRELPAALQVIGGFFRFLVRILATLLAVLIISGCIIGCVMTVTILGMVSGESEIDLTKLELNYTSIIYVKDPETGVYEEDTKLYGSNGRREWVDYDEIPQYVIDATVAAEDKRFWDHQGVDFVRTLSATLGWLTGNDAGGGSTITQQLIKNVTGDDAVRIDRKIREIFRAIALEKEYSKEQILEAYLNVVTFGYNTYGIQAASNLYFDKDVSELTLAEGAGLISMTQNPTKWDLFTNEKDRSRRDYIYDTMLEMGTITQEEHDTLYNTVLTTSKGSITETDSSKYQSWYTDFVIEQVISDLMNEYDWTYQKANEELYNGGYRIYSAEDRTVQTILEDKYKDEATFPAVVNEVQPDSCFVIMNYNGEVVAIVGGKGEKTGSRLFNIASDGVRHVGSAIKPISTYALAIETNLITYSTVITDEVVHHAGEEGFDADWPVNYYGSYLGPVTVEYAIQRSINTIPVKLVDLLTPRAVFDFLRDKLHISTLVESGYNNDVARAPMALGALTKGISPLELCAAYQMIGNGGLYISPHAYTEVLDSDGEVVLKANTTPERAVSAETAMILNKLTQRVVSGPHGTGTTANLSAQGITVAGKTGSATDNTDLWFVGLSPYYVGVTWLGYAEEMKEIVYYSYPTPVIWKNVMSAVHTAKGLNNSGEFPVSNNVVAESYCTETGDLATEYCPSTAIGWYKKSNEPSMCTEHYEGHTTNDESESGDTVRVDDSSGSSDTESDISVGQRIGY